MHRTSPHPEEASQTLSDPQSQKSAGVLLHVTSLPEKGQLDVNARQFVRWLHNCGFGLWQVLPLGPTHADRSPYLSLSANAGNPEMISLDEIFNDPELGKSWLNGLLRGHSLFSSDALMMEWQEDFCPEALDGYTRFVAQNSHWLKDYALFMAARSQHHALPWWQWPAPLRDRNPTSLAELETQNPSRIQAVYVEQFLFDRQWQKLRSLANELNIRILGDMPLYVAHDSVDVWANRNLFALTDKGEVALQAGVPPDAFSDTGQLWGNPVYNWPEHVATGFQWWIQRMNTQSRLYDCLRIDHFRGLQAYWEVPAEDKTAMGGHWVEAPGEALLRAVTEAMPQLQLVAEDLGIITVQVDTLRKQFNLPGMRIVEFAFDGDDDNPHRLFNHTPDSVVYTGTHDNDTVMGWFHSLDEDMRKTVRLGLNAEADESILDAAIDAALDSPGELTILPMQDILGLGSDCRMNTPATVDNNWRWKMHWDQLRGISASQWRERLKKFERLSDDESA